MEFTRIFDLKEKTITKNKANLDGCINLKKLLLLFILSMITFSVFAQPTFTIEGALQSKNNGEVVPFATLALHRLPDSSLVSGTISNAQGNFQISANEKGKYFLEISHIGFNAKTVNVNLNEKTKICTDEILLNEKTVKMESLTIVGERLKAKSDGNTTTYFMNKKLKDASFSGGDVLKHIPGIQTDFMQNISLEGSSKLILRVNGIERDIDYLRRLEASKIDKIEVISAPGSKYDAAVTGVINIVLEEKETGLSGHAYIEVPTSAETMYLFPSYSLNYGREKFNFYTSYNGEISYFDIENTEKRKIQSEVENTTIAVLENVRQKNWSHKFHFGSDFIPDKSNQFNFYGFLNPYSWEQDGQIHLDRQHENESNKSWSVTKNDDDKNFQSFASLYYKHIFVNKQEITTDISYYNLQANNSINFLSDSSSSTSPGNLKYTSQPNETRGILKLDYTHPFAENWQLNSGIKTSCSVLKDNANHNFRFKENIWAAYGELLFSKSVFEVQLGLRAEKSVSSLKDGFQNDEFDVLPHFLFNWKINSANQLKVIYRKSLNRPGLYELNPTESRSDPLKLNVGNPALTPEVSHYWATDFSSAFRGNFVSARVFLQQFNNSIQPFSYINDEAIFISQYQNMGDIFQYGLQVKGSLKLHKRITVNPYLQVFNIRSKTNGLAPEVDSENIALQSGLSTLISFTNGWSASFQLQYDMGLQYFQNKTYNDALYFVSVEKNINDKIKIGITSAVPFKNSVTYQATDISGSNFESNWQGNIRTNGFPLWLKLSYRFDSGKKVNKIQRVKEEIKVVPKKGF
ncbi:outer membrane beta-barrel family protein [Draconibacterium halophilum]|uniref:TonB-dependent receptor n=1 Tax=Draconibacterium halophilum TaxID=2706887 RepID=A0A6C0RGX2_9BACT|nr:outer membrane beta-barrel family protein [Draconibacterium halophilum]QIA09349.1 TonB-dependent receptor [Draconibacterium halophilum]